MRRKSTHIGIQFSRISRLHFHSCWQFALDILRFYRIHFQLFYILSTGDKALLLRHYNPYTSSCIPCTSPMSDGFFLCLQVSIYPAKQVCFHKHQLSVFFVLKLLQENVQNYFTSTFDILTSPIMVQNILFMIRCLAPVRLSHALAVSSVQRRNQDLQKSSRDHPINIDCAAKMFRPWN